MNRGSALLALFLSAATAAAQPPKVLAPTQPQPKVPTVEVVKLTLRPAAAPVPALKYQFLPELRDLKQGNAVTPYYRAFSPEWLTDRRPEVSKQMNAWSANIRKVPPDELRWVLKYSPLTEIELGAHRSYLDWEMTDRLRKDGIATQLPDIQYFRRFATLLAMRARLEMADGHLDQAAHTLQTGFTFSRHVSDAPTLIQALVGTATTALMLTETEELIQTPNSPNLYWALTQMPRPFIDLRKPYQGERIWLDQLFPGVRDMLANPKTPALSEREIQAAVDQLTGTLQDLNVSGGPEHWQARLGLAVLAAKAYPDGKRFLLAQGRPAKEVEAMPVLQVAILYEVHNHDSFFDDMVKWQSLPYWQARPGLQEMERRLRQSKDNGAPGMMLATLLLPAASKVQQASARTDRRIAVLRCVEAIRLYAAVHDGKLPAALADIKEVPIPDDPVTGNAFVYTAEGDRATLSGPPPAGDAPNPSNNVRYELTIAR